MESLIVFKGMHDCYVIIVRGCAAKSCTDSHAMESLIAFMGMQDC